MSETVGELLQRVPHVNIEQGGGKRAGVAEEVCAEFIRNDILATSFSRFYASSAGVYNAAHYILASLEDRPARRREVIERSVGVYVHDLAEGFVHMDRLIPRLRGATSDPIVDMEHLINDILRPSNPDMRKRLLQGPEIRYVLTDATTGEPELFSTHDDTIDDDTFWRRFLATAALPGLYNTVIDGYVDGGVSLTLPVDPALEEGAHIFVNSTRPPGYRNHPQPSIVRWGALRLMGGVQSDAVIKLVCGGDSGNFNRSMNNARAAKLGSLIIFSADPSLRIGRTTSSPQKLEEAMRITRQRARRFLEADVVRNKATGALEAESIDRPSKRFWPVPLRRVFQ